ncbi:MAG: hypothetical protein ACRDD7_01755 [Peptostreptococcaceae bacterium]
MGTFNGNLNFNIKQGELVTKTIIINEQNAAVLKGLVTFSDGTPVYKATVVLSYVDNNISTPLTFTLTDINGEFIIGIKNTSLDYILNVVYNEEYN